MIELFSVGQGGKTGLWVIMLEADQSQLVLVGPRGFELTEDPASVLKFVCKAAANEHISLFGNGDDSRWDEYAKFLSSLGSKPIPDGRWRGLYKEWCDRNKPGRARKHRPLKIVGPSPVAGKQPRGIAIREDQLPLF